MRSLRSGWRPQRRGYQCPLSISLECPASDDGGGTFLWALVPFAPRWQHIQFSLLPFALQILRCLTAADVPMLESVTQYKRSDMVEGNFDWGLFGLLRGPRISSFGMSTCNPTLIEMPLRWDRLTAISMLRALPYFGFWHPGLEATITSEKALHIISRCPELRSCRLRLDDRTAEMQAPYAIVEHRSLQTFDLCSASSASTFKRLLGRLSLPNLREFTLRVSREVSPDSPVNNPTPTEVDNGILALGSFLAASTDLESLDLENDGFPKPSLVQLLRSFPSAVQRLRIQAHVAESDGMWVPEPPPSFDDDILALFSPPPAGTACCPALRELYLHNPHMISDLSLLRLITSRTADAPCTALKRVWALFPREVQDDIMPDLQPFIRSGLAVYITADAAAEFLAMGWTGESPFEERASLGIW
ncbi:hypothetical protein DFH09DRAFT_411907 [Mycena vulgaris]|nr:hypothetical protein DFH09DRAFT_411907 [Mycena vulgaris]